MIDKTFYTKKSAVQEIGETIIIISMFGAIAGVTLAYFMINYLK